MTTPVLTSRDSDGARLRWNHPVEQAEPPMDRAELENVLRKMRGWQPFDADVLLDDLADALGRRHASRGVRRRTRSAPPRPLEATHRHRCCRKSGPGGRIGGPAHRAGAHSALRRHAGRPVERRRTPSAVGLDRKRADGTARRNRVPQGGDMTSTPASYSTLTKENNHPMRPGTKPSLIPFVTAREGEDAAPDNLIMLPDQYGARRLFYADEDPRDRPLPGVLWARCSFNPVDECHMPTGIPQWKLMHPYRQMLTMRTMHCQVCARPAQTPLGYCFFLPQSPAPDRARVLTNQPPVCAKHLRAAAELCPHVEPVVYLAKSAPPVRGPRHPVRPRQQGGDGHRTAGSPAALRAPAHAGHARLPADLSAHVLPRRRPGRTPAGAGRGRHIAPLSGGPDAPSSPGRRAGPTPGAGKRADDRPPRRAPLPAPGRNRPSTGPRTAAGPGCRPIPLSPEGRASRTDPITIEIKEGQRIRDPRAQRPCGPTPSTPPPTYCSGAARAVRGSPTRPRN